MISLNKKLETMLTKKQIFKNAMMLLVSSSLIMAGCKKDDPTPASNTITDAVVSGANFTTLETAVLKANLQTTLSSAGPFTVFAPDDAAFAASGITTATLNSLTAAQVENILLYHTIPARILKAGVPTGPNTAVTTASGDSVFVTNNASGVFVNGTQVTTADVTVDNGVIHVVNRVIMPASGNIVETAISAGLDSLVKAVLRATNAPGGDPSLAGTLSTAKLTVFAPTNAAFTQLLGILGLSRIDDIPVATLLAVLRYHVVAGRAFSSDLANGSLTMLASGSTTVSLTGGAKITGNGNGANASNITAVNITCRNGVVHLIDRVLLP